MIAPHSQKCFHAKITSTYNKIYTGTAKVQWKLYISSGYHKRQERKVWKTQFLQSAKTQLKVSQTRQKSNVTCIRSRQIHKWNFKSKSQKTREKNPENNIFAKGNNSSKSTSNATKVKLDQYHVKTKSFTKFQDNNSKDDWEKSGKPSGRTPSGLTDRRTEGQTDRLTDRRQWKPKVPPVSSVGD